MNKDLENLQDQLEKIEKMLKMSRLYGGKVSIGSENVTSGELKEMRTELKSKIAAEISNNTLRIVK